MAKGNQRTCKPLSKILVKAVAPGTTQETVNCTSDADFLLHGITNGGGDYSIGVKSTGVVDGYWLNYVYS